MISRSFKQEQTVSVKALRFKDGGLREDSIVLAREVPYTLFLNDREIMSISTLPAHLEDLFVGFLVSEGVLKDPEEIEACVVDIASKLVRIDVNVPEERQEILQRKGMLTSGCAGGLLFTAEGDSLESERPAEPLALNCSAILDRMRHLDTHDGMYRLTRGVHSASACTASETLVIREDLGRHNAVDKVVGHCFLNRIPTHDKMLLTTGRITSEVLTKAARMGFPIIVSRSSASAMAAGLAMQHHIDLATYVRAGRFNYISTGAVDLQQD